MKTKRHLGLLVEDNDLHAGLIEAELESLGIDCKRARSKLEAEELLEKHRFCFVLLDREIPLRVGGVASVNMGDALIPFIKESFPGENDGGERCLPIVVTSLHAKERDQAFALRRMGAEDVVIDKPPKDNVPSFPEKIREVLRRSGRETHGLCDVADRMARGASYAAATDLIHVVLAGRRSDVGRDRLEIVIGSETVALRSMSFVMLLLLYAARYAEEPELGIHHKELVGVGLKWRKDLLYQRASRLNDDLRNLLPGKPKVAINNRLRYRLNPRIVVEDPPLDAIKVCGEDAARIIAEWIERRRRENSTAAAGS